MWAPVELLGDLLKGRRLGGDVHLAGRDSSARRLIRAPSTAQAPKISTFPWPNSPLSSSGRANQRLDAEALGYATVVDDPHVAFGGGRVRAGAAGRRRARPESS